MLARMATTRTPKPPAKPPAKRASAARKTATKPQPAAKTSRERAPAEAEAPAATPSRVTNKPAKKVANKPASRSRAAPAKDTGKRAGARPKGVGEASSSAAPKPRSAAQRDAVFDTLARNACLKAGTAAAISSLTRRVPLLGRLAPTLLGPLAETVALAQVQKQLVAGIIELYEVELSDPEMRGVVLLATATNIGAQQLSKRSLDAILKQFGEGVIGTVAARVLPMATILAEITAAVASTYTVAKRAQALCKLPGTGAGNLADLLRGLSGIDQQRLLSWSGEAFRLALVPFKSVLGMMWR